MLNSFCQAYPSLCQVFQDNFYPCVQMAGADNSCYSLKLAILQKMLRPIVVYAFLIIGLRIAGKRELAQLNPFDFVVLLSLSNTVQNAIIGPDNSITGGIIGATTLLAVNYLVVRFFFKHKRLDQIFEGESTVLIEHGQLCKEGLAKELLTESELIAIAHRQGFSSLNDVETCTLEPGGTFFLQGKEPSSSEQQYKNLCTRLEELSRQMADLQQRLPAPK